MIHAKKNARNTVYDQRENENNSQSVNLYKRQSFERYSGGCFLLLNNQIRQDVHFKKNTKSDILKYMEKISKEEVRHLAELSSISLSDDEVSNLQTDLGNIVEYIEQLSELNTDGVEPTYSVSKNQNVWREDEINDYGVKRAELLKLAGDNVEDNQVKVPKVL